MLFCFINKIKFPYGVLLQRIPYGARVFFIRFVHLFLLE